MKYSKKDDIIKNPYEIEFTEMDSTMIPQALDEFDYAVITGSIVYNAGIDASSALLQEDVLEHLLLQVVVKEKNKDTKWAKAIVEAYRSKEFKEYLDKEIQSQPTHSERDRGSRGQQHFLGV